MDGYAFLICLVAAVSYCSSAPDPLDTLNININLDGSQTSAIPPTPPPTDFNCTCGIKNPRIDQPTSRIVGGNNTGIFEYPWMVSIKKFFKKFNIYRQQCGGVLVASQWVLTAAHCIVRGEFHTSDTFIFLGEHDQTKDDETDKTRMFKIRKMIVHSDYDNDFPNNNDIALIKLDRYADLNIYTPACMSEANQFFPGKKGTVLGWGRIAPHGPDSDQLQWLHVTVGSDEYCHEKDPQGLDYFTWTITCGSQLGIVGKGECIGDSGGPVTVPYFGRHYLVGLVSGGSGGLVACGVGYVTIYASVAKLRNWIDQTIEENGGAAYCTPTPFPFHRDEK